MLVLFIYAVQKEELKLKKRKCLLQYKFTKFVLIYYKISEEYKMKYSKFLLFIYIVLYYELLAILQIIDLKVTHQNHDYIAVMEYYLARLL